MDTQELFKIFRQRLENALKSKENFKGKNQIKFIEIEDGTCCFHYRGQDFTVEWWTYEKEQCLECSFYCHEVQTTEIDFDFESFDYSLNLEPMETEDDIDSNIYEIVDIIYKLLHGSYSKENAFVGFDDDGNFVSFDKIQDHIDVNDVVDWMMKRPQDLDKDVWAEVLECIGR